MLISRNVALISLDVRMPCSAYITKIKSFRLDHIEVKLRNLVSHTDHKEMLCMKNLPIWDPH